jgi:hypothetical protein
VHLRRDQDGRCGVVQHEIDAATRGPVHGHLGVSAPARMGDAQQLLDDPGLDVIANRRPRIREQPDGQISPERLADRREGRDARLPLSGFDLPQEGVADAGGVGNVAETEPAVCPIGAKLLPELAANQGCTTSRRGSGTLSASSDATMHDAIEAGRAYLAIVAAGSFVRPRLTISACRTPHGPIRRRASAAGERFARNGPSTGAPTPICPPRANGSHGMVRRRAPRRLFVRRGRTVRPEWSVVGRPDADLSAAGGRRRLLRSYRGCPGAPDGY